MAVRRAVLTELAEALAVMRRPHPLRVGIDGIDAAGKTTLADELAPLVEARGRTVLRVSLDDFHRPRDERYRRGELSPEGFWLDTFDYDAVREVLLGPLGPGGDGRVRTRIWDHVGNQPVPEEWFAVEPDTIVVCDGVFLQRNELRHLWDATVFVAVDIDVAVERAVARDAAWLPSVEAARERYRLRYTPAQKRYLAELHPRERADFVFENTDPEHPHLDRRRS